MVYQSIEMLHTLLSAVEYKALFGIEMDYWILIILFGGTSFKNTNVG
jgi:hypothetical protein